MASENTAPVQPVEEQPEDNASQELQNEGVEKILHSKSQHKIEKSYRRGLMALIDLIKDLIEKIKMWHFAMHYDVNAEDRANKYQEQVQLLQQQLAHASDIKRPTQESLVHAITDVMMNLDPEHQSLQDIMRALQKQFPDMSRQTVEEMLENIKEAGDRTNKAFISALDKKAEQWVDTQLKLHEGNINDPAISGAIELALINTIQTFQQTSRGEFGQKGVTAEYLAHLASAIETQLHAKGLEQLSPAYTSQIETIIAEQKRLERTVNQDELAITVKHAAADINAIWNSHISALQSKDDFQNNGQQEQAISEEARREEVRAYIKEFYETKFYDADLQTVAGKTQELRRQIDSDCLDILNEEAKQAEINAFRRDLYDIENGSHSDEEAKNRSRDYIRQAGQLDVMFVQAAVLKSAGEYLKEHDASGVYKDGKTPICYHIGEGIEAQENIRTAMQQFFTTLDANQNGLTDPDVQQQLAEQKSAINTICEQCMQEGNVPGGDLKAVMQSIAREFDKQASIAPHEPVDDLDAPDTIDFGSGLNSRYQVMTDELINNLGAFQKTTTRTQTIESLTK